MLQRKTVNNTLKVACPVCDNKREVSPYTLSGNCTKCGAYYRIEKGAVVFPKYLEEKEREAPHLRKSHRTNPHESTQKSVEDNKSYKHGKKEGRTYPKSELIGHLGGLLPDTKKQREIACFDCGKSHKILASSSSSMCPNCGGYISLRDYEIREEWNQRIQTRGNVHIHRKGKVYGILVKCHDFEVDGFFDGGAECSGNFVLRKDARLRQVVKCEIFRLEKRATAEFSKPLIAKEIIIDGQVYGDLYCHRLVLEPNARLDGDVETKVLVVKEGAMHRGRVSVKDFDRKRIIKEKGMQ